ncbi:MAG: cysteine--tRNA ligase [Pseudomonadales bacterium]|jgi:cysteinyl-tRNA synthetase|nr:cysteine--tRNA ligase [Pseudomonadales bacterium]
MSLRLHDTLTGTTRPFEPGDPTRVTMYVCGPTVYDRIHIGNARSAVVFDVLYRLLRQRYPQVLFARNFTDVDDRINAAAAAEGVPISVLAERYASTYEEDMAALGNLAPDLTPRATHHIDEMIAMISRLIERGCAYEAEGHALFAVESDPAYGRLSHRDLDDMIAGARVEVAPYKRHPADFVLWKPSTPEQPGWESPWGRGRPGWHIECSAMIEKHLGEVIDIHGGGRDLVFPHHENELAQSSCAHGHPAFVRYWLHNGMLTFDGEKMSKSIGNVVKVAELRERFHGEVLRYALLSAHYRSSLSWSEDLLVQARASMDRLYGALRVAAPDLTGPDAAESAPDERVVAALEDDLNTPEALAALHALAAEIHRAEDPASRRTAAACLRASAACLGLAQDAPEHYFRHAPGVSTGPDEDAIARRIDDRAEARRMRDFARADAIRDALLAEGIELEDSAEGTRWRRVH